MKTTLVSAAAVLALAAPCLAESALDANGDGSVTFDEVLAVYPETTESAFVAMDSDGDGLLSPEEIAAAQRTGFLPL
ncbi:hypothetical protein [Oceaniglobus roseus]|uniref:hypothetical protein n=1 Tax=Oceaniglobus roseus TaxID=1737570 RepID=UPI000C7EE2FA|nr:hypothetical protein [Kandeliimicrobium roseum]